MSLEKGICVGGTKVIYFHLKGCMVGQKCKNNISGRTKLFYMPKYFRRGGS